MSRSRNPARTALFVFCALLGLFAVVVAINDRAIPLHDTDATHFDAIIVLGTPATLRGNPSNTMRERVLEAIREYDAGVATHIIVTGGAAHNQFVEADIMAKFAEAHGVPASAVFEERQATNTIQNVYYSSQIMRAHGWHTAEVISSHAHIPRAAMILADFDRRQPSLAFHWSTRIAPWPQELNILHIYAIDALEASRCLYYRIVGFPASQFLPGK
jgi:uncharacterized SAM-binding protein YcdF (DUF218 family)